MSEPRLQQFLHENHIQFQTIHHSRAVTARETAQRAHVPDSALAKTVVVKLDGRLAMVVLAANQRLDLSALKEATGAGSAELAPESEFAPLFPDCETGAMPPFGNLYGMDVYVDESLTDDDEIAFNAGTHTELIRIPYALFEQLVHPRHLRRVHRITH
ncbi:aminoacyl-tRNA deacylase [Tahibacter amnicola]|uniref:YbaK/EbsC family protein n=1 Tax=Tahibacter amnicola TaxID=2976241 RepID=A0ABY6BK57_9GAMM|nr:YbaK/EbsC family protein [Tahibacter amnicola]UXI69778.1 YbaK/EbsC family protein [Tahibacter amnicola]